MKVVDLSHDSVAALADALASGGILPRRSARSGWGVDVSPERNKNCLRSWPMDGGLVRPNENGGIEGQRAVDVASVNL
jgi:hypothetical protein